MVVVGTVFEEATGAFREAEAVHGVEQREKAVEETVTIGKSGEEQGVMWSSSTTSTVSGGGGGNCGTHIGSTATTTTLDRELCAHER